MTISKDIVCCPYCGSEEYYIKQYAHGSINYNVRFDGKEADNGEMYDLLTIKNTSKYAWCNECGKRLFKLED